MKIINTRIEKNKIIVFYEFENGEVNNNEFLLTSPTLGIDMVKWGEDREIWFKNREIEIQEEIKKAQEEAEINQLLEIIQE